MRPLTNLQVFVNFWHKQLFISTCICRFISDRLVSLPQVENDVKRPRSADVAEIQEAITDELKEAKKEEYSAAFQVLWDCAKSYTRVYANRAYFQ